MSTYFQVSFPLYDLAKMGVNYTTVPLYLVINEMAP